MSDAQLPSTNSATGQVGYGNPPKEHQWKKGQSGNPAGKKKGAKNFGALFKKVAMKSVPVTLGSKTQMMTFMELVTNAPFMYGAKGDKANLVHALKLSAEHLQHAKEEPPKHGEITQEGDGKFYYNAWVEEEAIEKARQYFEGLRKRDPVVDAMMKERGL